MWQNLGFYVLHQNLHVFNIKKKLSEKNLIVNVMFL